jgi:rod shape-determining protein MreD
VSALFRWTADRVEGRRTRGINRAPSPLLAALVPWLSIMLLSLLSATTGVASAPALPPLAFMALLAWRMLRPGMLPVSVGFPLGAVEDLYSGQPFGSAILLWSCAMLAMELIDANLRWRGFLLDWAIAGVLVVIYLAASSIIAGGGRDGLVAIIPQAVLAVLVQPLVTRLVALLDRIRLLPLTRAE